MRHRSRASLGSITRGLLAAGLCTLAASAQQSATPAAPAAAQTSTAPANETNASPSSGVEQSQQPTVPEAGAATGVSNPDPVLLEAESTRTASEEQDGSATLADATSAREPQSAASAAETETPLIVPAATSDGQTQPPAPPASDTNTAPSQTPASPAPAEMPAQQNVPATPDAATPPPASDAPVSPAQGASDPPPQQSAPTPSAAPAESPAQQNVPATPDPVPTSTPADASAPQQSAPAPAPAPDAAAPATSAPAPDATPVSAPPAEPPSTTQTPAAPDASVVNPSAPAPQVNEAEPPPASRLDIFAGYAYLRPSGSVGIWSFPDNNTRGYIASGTYYFTRHLGVQAEFSHSEYPLGTTGTSPVPPFVQLGGVTDSFYTVEGGPVYRFFLGQHLIPFVHVVGGGAKIAGPKFQPLTWGYGVAAGGGVDVLLPHTHEHVAFRLAQADYEYMHADQGALQQYDLAGGSQDVTALRLSAGLVFRFGEMNPSLPKALACDASPSEVYAGERVTLAANLRNYRNKTPFAFRWELSAGKQQGFGPVIFVDTTGLPGGTYHATAHISVKEKGKQFAQCSTNFIVKASPPPTLKCSADPSTVTPGQVSTITAYATSIAQRQLTYTYTTSEGQISGTDNTAQLHTDGLPPGMATVTCRVRDDLGQTAVATTEVTVAPPALPPAPKAQPLCTVYFNRDMRRPARVDNEGRACLDDVALTLEHQPDARLVLVGEHSESEVDGQLTAAERAMNTRAYLANEKGIDPSRVDVRTSTTPGRQVQTFLLAPGAVFDQPTEGRIDESKIKIHGQQYVNQRNRASQKGPVGHGVSHPPTN